MDREKLEFKYFFNAGLDRVTCECDVEGTDVFEDGHYIGSVKWKYPEELEAMSDEELEEEFAWNGILL
jgi:hypothetical protein